MLRIIRRSGQAIQIGDDITVKVMHVEEGRVTLGIRTNSATTRVTRIRNGPRGQYETREFINLVVEGEK